MKETIIFLFIIWMHLLTSCHSKENEELFTIEINPNRFSEISLSEISDDIQAIELELTEESHIRNINLQHRVITVDDYIVILDGLMIHEDEYRRQILLFDKKGKFIRSIAHLGEDVGEYTQIQDIEVDSQNKTLYILSNTKIMCYDLEGNFIKELMLEGYPKYLYAIENKLFFSCRYFLSGYKFRIPSFLG